MCYNSINTEEIYYSRRIKMNGINGRRIYADNAATTKMSKRAIEAMLPYLDGIYGNPSSLHSEGQAAAEALAAARERIARCLGCSAGEITFTSGGSESDNQALLSAAEIGSKKGKRHIISSNIEHHAVLHTLERLKKRGFDVTLVGVGENGAVSVSDVEAAMRDDTCLVSIMYANNEIGTLQPISEIGALCRSRGVPFHTDAVQAAGHLDIDVGRQGIDMLSLSAHKFNGPKGVGALYARRGMPLVSLIAGGAQERGKRAGTENLPAIVGMAEALDEACAKISASTPRLIKMRDRLIDGIGALPHTVLNGDRYNRLPSNVSFCFEGIEGEALLLLLDDMGIAASSGSACTSGSLDPSHVLLAIGRVHDIAHGSLRLSISEENTEEDIEYIISSVRCAVERLRAMSPVWRELVSGKRKFITEE